MTRKKTLLMILTTLASLILLYNGEKVPGNLCAQLPCDLRQSFGCFPCPIQVDPTVKN